MRLAYTVLSSTIMVLALTGHLSPLSVMIIVAIMGLIRPSDLGVRGALLADIMVEHFLGQVIAKQKIGGRARAMVVTSSIPRCIEYFHAIRDALAKALADD